MKSEENKVFVSNLAWDITTEELFDFFSTIGNVLDAIVLKDRDTQKSRGFGFVTLSSPAEVQIAIDKLNGADFRGRRLRVDKAHPKTQTYEGGR